MIDWSATLAGKGVDVNTFRESDAASTELALEYYSAELHRGALSLPSFMRRQLGD